MRLGWMTLSAGLYSEVDDPWKKAGGMWDGLNLELRVREWQPITRVMIWYGLAMGEMNLNALMGYVLELIVSVDRLLWICKSLVAALIVVPTGRV